MIEIYLRPSYNRICVMPVAKLLVKTHIQSNMLTLLAAILGIVAMFFIMCRVNSVAIVALLMSGYLDTLDGTLARLRETSSARGCVYDILSDRVVEIAVLSGLYMIDPSHRGVACFWLLGSFYLCITAFLTIGMFVQNTSNKGFHYSAGLIERAEVFVFFVAMILLPHWFNVLAWFLTALVLLTTYLHISRFVNTT